VPISARSTAHLTPAEREVIRLRALYATRPESPPAARFGTPGMISPDQDMEALHHAAKQYQATHPGTAYIDAVRSAQLLGWG
jgi:hypothetical protein